MISVYAVRSGLAAAAVLACASLPVQAASLRLCNGIQDAVEFAINVREKNGLTQTQGWWKVDPGACSEYVPRGPTGIYYLHVKKRGGSSISLNVGDRSITTCAARTDFTDRPHEHRSDRKLKCAEHGLMSLKFMRFEVSRSDLDDVLILEAGGNVTVINGASPPRATCKRFPSVC